MTLFQKISFRVGILVLIASFGLTGCGKGCGKGAQKPSSSASLALLPQDSNIVLVLDWKRLKDSSLGNKLLAQVPAQVAPLLDNVEALTLGIKAQGIDKAGTEQIVGVVSGQLDAQALLAQMTQQAQQEGSKVNEEIYKGAKIYSDSKDPDLGVVFLEQKAALGKKDALKKVIELSQGNGDSVEKNSGVMELIRGVDQSRMLWAVVLPPKDAFPADEADANNPMAILSSIKAVDLSAEFSKNLAVDLGIISSSDEEAKKLLTMANTYKNLFGGAMGAQDPSVGKVMESLNLEANGKRVLLSLKLDKATVDELSEKAAINKKPNHEGHQH